MLAKIVALSLIILAASPFTAPFSTCNLFEHESPARRQSTGGATSYDSAISVAGAACSSAAAAAACVEDAGTIAIAADPPADVRSDADPGVQVRPLPIVTFGTDSAVSQALHRLKLQPEQHGLKGVIRPPTVLRL
jgi:hypothetical protein